VEFDQVRTIVFSPHADDAALSCGGTILLGALPRPLAVVTAFSESAFVPGFGAELTREEAARRRAGEDAAFCAEIRATWIRLGLPDPLLRGYESFASMFDPRAEPRREPLFDALRGRVYSVPDVYPGARLLLAPLGLGTHIDHLMLREAAKDLGRERGLPVAYYEDLPYANEIEPDKILDHALSVDAGLRPRDFDVSRVMEAKVRLVEIYASQDVSHFVRSVLAYGRRLAGPEPGWRERFWRDLNGRDWRDP